MGDGSSSGEADARAIVRGMQDIAGLLRDGVGRHEYLADQRHVDHRFTDLETDVGDLKKMHTDDVKGISDQITTHLRDHRTDDQNSRTSERADWRQFMYAGIAPFAIGIIIAVFSAWLATRGGK